MKKNGLNYLIYFLVFLIILAILYILFYDMLFKKKIDFLFNSSTLDVKIGDKNKIDYYLSDETYHIDWESSDSKVAVVDNSGFVIGIDFGSTIITGTITVDEEKITRSCFVQVYDGDKNTPLKNISFPEGEIIMPINSELDIPLSINPTNGYMTSFRYSIDDETIAVIKNDKIHALKEGITSLRAMVNNELKANININVLNASFNPIVAKVLLNASLNDQKIVMQPGDIKELGYTLLPIDGYVYQQKWESSNSEIVSVADGKITAIKSGEAEIILTINNFTTKCKVIVNVPVESINITYKSRNVISIGETTKVVASVLPANATNKNLIYESSKPTIATIDSTGKITGRTSGTTTITIKSSDGNKSTSYNVQVLPRSGIINNSSGVFQYTIAEEKVPTRADLSFFSNLVSKGKGSISGTTYSYTYKGVNYRYDVGASLLYVNNSRLLVRIYYPKNTDLSNLNTHTFLGGTGEANFGSYFKTIDGNLSIIKSRGITILVSYSGSVPYDSGMVIHATNFVKAIVDQKSHVTNTVGGYSYGGPYAASAAEAGPYDRLFIVHSYFNRPQAFTNLKNKTIYFYSPAGDGLYGSTMNTLNRMSETNYGNVIIVSNNTDYSKYSSKYLVINPGTAMGRGHASTNITDAKYFSFANE